MTGSSSGTEGAVLFLAAHLPSMSVPEAGQKIAYSNLRQLSEKNDVYLVSFANELETQFLKKESFCFCSFAKIIPISSISRAYGCILNPTLPLKISARSHTYFRSTVIDLIKNIDFISAHLEYTAAGQYLPLLREIPKKTIVEHDVCYQLFQRRADIHVGFRKVCLTLEAHRMKRWELRTLAGFDRVVTLNDKDRDLLIRDGLPENKVVVQPPQIDAQFSQTRRDRVEPGTLLLWGAFGREENADAARWFLDEIFPKLLACRPDCVAYLVGANPPPDIRGRASTNVKVTGFVESPIPYFEKAQVSVAPLRLGAGVKLKVLEALAARIPVVATEVGAEGIDDPLLVVANSADDFAHKVLQLIGSQVGEKDDKSHSQ